MDEYCGDRNKIYTEFILELLEAGGCDVSVSQSRDVWLKVLPGRSYVKQIQYEHTVADFDAKSTNVEQLGGTGPGSAETGDGHADGVGALVPADPLPVAEATVVANVPRPGAVMTGPLHAPHDAAASSEASGRGSHCGDRCVGSDSDGEEKRGEADQDPLLGGNGASSGCVGDPPVSPGRRGPPLFAIPVPVQDVVPVDGDEAGTTPSGSRGAVTAQATVTSSRSLGKRRLAAPRLELDEPSLSSARDVYNLDHVQIPKPAHDWRGALDSDGSCSPRQDFPKTAPSRHDSAFAFPDSMTADSTRSLNATRSRRVSAPSVATSGPVPSVFNTPVRGTREGGMKSPKGASEQRLSRGALTTSVDREAARAADAAQDLAEEEDVQNDLDEAMKQRSVRVELLAVLSCLIGKGMGRII